MAESPKVSVIVPVYNTAPYLEQCLESIRTQTLKEIEIICIDDASTDGSLDILKKYEKEDSRFTVLTQEKSNAGVARNRGLEIARGEFLSFLDSDDFFDPQMLEKAYLHAKKQNSDIVIFRTKRYWEEDQTYTSADWTVKQELLPNSANFIAKDIPENVFLCILGYAWDKLFSRQFIQEINAQFQSLSVFNDSFFTYSALLQANCISLLNEELIFQRKRSVKQSITDTRAKYFDCSYQLLRALYELLIKLGLLERFERDFINYAVHLFAVDLSNKHGSTRRKMIQCLKDKWIQEFDINGKKEDYFYDFDEFKRFIMDVYPITELEQRAAYASSSPTTIPVVYATDDNYFKYVICSIVSAIQHSCSKIHYRFIILLSQGSDKENQKKLEEIVACYDNCTVEFFEIGNQFENAHLCIEHITVATYYRLLLPAILSDCDKCIYLDGDTIVADDLLGLYSIPMGNNHLAGVKAYVYYETALEHKKRLQIPSNIKFEYINAGVLVMNLKQMRQDHCMEKYMELINEKFDSQDQDILNIVSVGKIKTIPFRYNVMTKYCRWSQERLNSCDIQKEVMRGRQMPIIIHYADRVKPWANMRSVLAEYWWENILLVPCWNIFANEYLEMILNTVYRSQQNSKVSRIERELKQLKASRSYRIGRMITFIPRKLRGGIACYKDHGFQYTVWRAWQKVKRGRHI